MKNTRRAAARKHAHDAAGTNKLPLSKRAQCPQQQHFDSAHGFIRLPRPRRGLDAAKIFDSVRAKTAVAPDFSGPRAPCRLSRYVNANFLARIFT
jgi:hypothetical protein